MQTLRVEKKCPTAGERVKAWLDAHGITQQALAESVGIDPSHLSSILSGSRKPSLVVAARIERETGIPASAFAEVA